MKDFSYSKRLIRETPEDERPQERLLASGPEALSTAELLALIIRSGSRKRSALELSETILDNYNRDLRLLRNAKSSELYNNDMLQGLGPAKACQIIASIELGRRMFTKLTAQNCQFIHTAADAGLVLLDQLRFEQQEKFCTILLNVKNEILDFRIITTGTLSASLVHPREVFIPAIRSHAAKLILGHNHPSGDPTPSREDRQITSEIARCGELLQIPVLDHIIVGGDHFLSMKDLNLF